MKIKRIKSGTRMSQAVVHNDIVTTAGQVAMNAIGGSVADQTKDILGAIDELLAAAGSDKAQLLTATIWLSDMTGFAEMNSIWDAWIVEGCAPTRACVESKLAAPGLDVEISITAVVP